MGSFKIIFLALTFLGIAMTKTMARRYVVGNGKGWRLGVNYQAWARGKTFRVGDELLFRFPTGQHNIIKVGEDEFRSCRPFPDSPILGASGNDTVQLRVVGRNLYLCGVGAHCATGPMKLAINVKA